jgi:VWFA-related protein
MIGVVALVVSAFAAVDARQQSVFRAETNYVEVVASVTDRDGRFVTGLTAADFEIKEQGRRESIDNFTFVELPVSGGAATMPAAYRADLPQEARTAEGRLYLIYLNGATASNTSHVRQLAAQFVREHIMPGDRAAVWDSQFPRRDVTFTDDKSKLQADIEPYTGVSFGGTELPFAFGCTHSSGGARELCQAALLDPYTQLKKAVDWFNAIQGRRKSIVLFAGGWDGPTDPVSRADITLYAVDVRGLIAPDPEMLGVNSGLTGAALVNEVGNRMTALNRSVDGLWTLAQRTGGFALVNKNEFANGFRRIVEANSQYYVLGYASSFTRHDRVFRELDVKVKRPGLKVHARRGYFPRF